MKQKAKKLAQESKISYEDALQKLIDLDRQDHKDTTEFDCTICLLLMINPIPLPTCKHIFCQICIQKFKERTCPLCREQYDPKLLKVDEDLQLAIKMKYPDEFNRRWYTKTGNKKKKKK